MIFPLLQIAPHYGSAVPVNLDQLMQEGPEHSHFVADERFVVRTEEADSQIVHSRALGLVP